MITEMDDEPTTAGTAGASHPDSEALARVTTAVAELIAGVPGDGWTAPTPCLDWDVRQLVQHLVAGNLAGAAILARQVPPAGSVDRLGEDPLAAFRDSAAQLMSAFAAPGVLQAQYRSPVGTVPGAVMRHLRITEHLVHGWDIARATGRRATALLPADLAEQELGFSRAALTDEIRAGGSFGPVQPVPDDAPAVDRLAAYLGRTVGN